MSGIIDSDDQVFFAECLGPTSLPSITISFNDVDWEGLLRAEGGGRTAQATSLIDMKDGSCHNLSHVLLTEDDVQRIKIADMQVLDFVSGDVEDARAYTAALLKLLYLSTSDSSVQLFAVSRIQAILSDQEGETAGLFENQEGTAVDPAPFLRAIRGGDAKVQAVASISLALICAHTGCTTAAGGLVDWICSEIEEGRACNSSVRATVTALTVLLRQRGARLMFIAKGGVTLLNSMLRMQGGDAANMQLLYELCFCLWCLSFEEDALSDFSGCCAVATLSQQVSASLREKIVRVSLSALCRLTYSALIICFCRDMIACGLLNTLEKFKSRPWSDPDIVADAEELRILLLKNHRYIGRIAFLCACPLVVFEYLNLNSLVMITFPFSIFQGDYDFRMLFSGGHVRTVEVGRPTYGTILEGNG